MIEIKPVAAFRDNYIWFVINSDNHTVAITDPGDAEPVLKAIEAWELTPVALLITHHHPDHTGGVKQLLDHFNVPVYGPANETIPELTHSVREDDIVTLDELAVSFRVIEVPGHTAGHIAYYGHDSLLIGDTLFMAGCGRLFEGSAAQMRASLEKLLSLPDTTQIYCAHEYTLSNLLFARAVEPDNPDIATRLAACEKLRDNNLPTVPGRLSMEKKTNPFLRWEHPDIIAAAKQYTGRPARDATEVFAAIRAWKDNFRA